MRLSVTTVEAFRLYRDTGDWMALETLEAQIRKDEPPNEKMLRGIAFHSVLERPERVEAMGSAYYEADGYRFFADGMDRVLAMLPMDRVPEAKMTFDVDGITVVGKGDALRGLTVYEAKTSERIDVEKYIDSFQWRAYLHGFRAMQVRYLVAQIKPEGQHITVADVVPFDFYRYPALEADVRRLTHDCAAFIVSRGLEGYVKDLEAA